MPVELRAVAPSLDEHRAVYSSLGRWTAALADEIGVQVLTAIAAFAEGATPGSMITVRCTRDGFTAQTTGAIVGGRPEPITHQAIRELLLDDDLDDEMEAES